MTFNIAVYGSATSNIDPETLKKSREIGALIAKNNHIIITGRCPGIPHEAAKSAYKEGGKTIAYSPATGLEQHKKINFPTDCTTQFVFIPKDYKNERNIEICKKYRNISSVSACDAAIIISGRIGTLNEFTIAYDLGKTIGILQNTGGITIHIQNLTKHLNKKTDAKIIYSKEPEDLVSIVLEMLSLI